MYNIQKFIFRIILILLSLFFITYSMQPQRNYPDFIINLLYHPWLLYIIMICILLLFTINEKFSILLILIYMFFIIDILLLGTEGVNINNLKL
jgi:uncharacterized membrane protein